MINLSSIASLYLVKSQEFFFSKSLFSTPYIPFQGDSVHIIALLPTSIFLKMISFDILPYDLRKEIHKKFTYNQFAIFEECSKSSSLFCKNLSSMRFPYFANFTVLLGRGGVHRKSRISQIFTLFDFQNTPSAWIQTKRLEILGEPPSDFCAYIIERFRGVECLVIYGFSEASEAYHQLLSNFRLEEHVLHISGSDNDLDLPKDFGDIAKVSLTNCRQLTTEDCFSIKSKQLLQLEDCSFLPNQLFEELQEWTKGKQFASREIRFTNFHDFDFENFMTKMAEHYPIIYGQKYPSIHDNVAPTQIFILEREEQH